LVHVAFPALEGWRRFLKRAMDIVGSGLLVLLLSPVFLIVAMVVKATSPGPIFYRQERIGRQGLPFGMIKFRSMIQNADDQLATLLDLQGTGDKPLFKVVDDPRITPVGSFLRKYSIDELPQLLNVLFGEMSLVGPRPQRPAEVALYDDIAHRRLRVKPGMSGLWQVSGRSALSWEDALRLDLYYIENWSLAQDMIILFRTFRAVIRPEGTAH
jgi:exopolysaccharide biosynthesis polyprenyl glycosylphosphotransferase